MVGTLVNAGAIVVGGLAGLAVRSRLPEKATALVFQGIGLVTLTIGMSMALRSQNLVLAVVSLAVGALLGQWIDIDRGLNRLCGRLQRRGAQEDGAPGRFTEGFMTATLLFCTGSMAILGAIEEGMGNTPQLLFTKSIMDGISSVVLGATFGVSILFSSLPLLIYQGGLTLLAAFLMRFMSEGMMADLTGVGGILLIGLSLNILKIKEIKIVNMLPALVVLVVLSYCWP